MSPQRRSFSAVVLAGGLSRRMGQDKAWLQMERHPLLVRQTLLAKELGAEEVFISGRSEVHYPFGLPVLLDLWPGLGPLGGIERALAMARNTAVLVLAVDLPYLSIGLLQSLLSNVTSKTPTCSERSLWKSSSFANSSDGPPTSISEVCPKH